MNQILNRSISISTLIISFLGIYFFKDQSGIYIILISIFMCNETLNYFLNWNKLKGKTNFKIGQRKEAFWYSLLLLVIGLYFISLTIKETSNSTHNLIGMWFYIFNSIAMISISILKYENFQLYLKDNSIVFFDLKKRKDWKISTIDKVIMNNKSIILMRGSYKKEFYIDEKSNEVQTLKEYFANKLQDRFEFNK